jgi:cation diffusion facilitator CzcD-associated flavoprotein CzcO
LNRHRFEVKQSSDSAQRKTDLLVVGAGPFGLAVSAYARHLGIEHLIVGKPMGFWKANMPKGMYLRSACDWHLDPLNVDTIEKFLGTKRLSTKDVEPLSLEFYLSYAQWFQEQKQISVLPTLVRELDSDDSEEFRFRAVMNNGENVTAKFVVVAVGFQYFKNLPSDLIKLLPEDRYSHTCARISNGRVKLWPKTRVVKCLELSSGDVAVSMDNGQKITVDRIVLATGYKAEFGQVPFLRGSKILGGLNIQDGFPELDEHFQSSVPGMFITSLPATQQFGPFFAFTIAVRASARLIGQAIFAEGI